MPAAEPAFRTAADLISRVRDSSLATPGIYGSNPGGAKHRRTLDGDIEAQAVGFRQCSFPWRARWSPLLDTCSKANRSEQLSANCLELPLKRQHASAHRAGAKFRAYRPRHALNIIRRGRLCWQVL